MRAMESARVLMQDIYAYRWRHELRVKLLEGRIALLQSEPERALALAERLIAAATDRYAPRYAQLGEVLRLQARAALRALRSRRRTRWPSSARRCPRLPASKPGG